MIALQDLSPEDEVYVNKALTQFRLVLGDEQHGPLRPFNMYGMGIYIAPAVEAIMELAWALHLRLTGLDVPIQLEEETWIQPD